MAMATPAELEAVVAALTDKKRRLREAFDRLVACSPVPVPFRCEDLDAHLASIAASFRHLDSSHAEAIAGAAAAAAAAGEPTTAAHGVQHPDREEQGRVRGASEEGQGSNAEEVEEGGNASSHQERGEENGEVRETSIARPDREADRAGNILDVEAVPIEAAPEQPDDEKEEEHAMGAIVASPHQRDDNIEMLEEEEEEAVNASAGREGREDKAEEGEWLQHPHAAGGGETALARAVAAACANMDPSTLVNVLCLSGRSPLPARRAFLPALLGALDPHALLIRAVGGFLDLASAGRDASEWWANCVALIECAPRLAAPPADALAQAKRLAEHWKEMVVARPAGAGGRDMGGMAGWGLLTFIASYNIVPEFKGDEFIHLFGDIAPQVKDSCVELCKRLGLIKMMTDSINHFIENGQPLDAIRLAHTFSLTDKYPPLTIMNDYVENAKKAAEDILLSKESYTLESLNQAMAKKVDALIFSWSAIDGCDIDSVQRNSIKSEITQLLHKYANKQQSLAGISASTSSSHQQQNFQEEYQQGPQMRLVEQQQRKPHELQQKPEERQHPQQKPQETQHGHIENQLEPHKREMWQNPKRKRPNKNRRRKQRRQNLQHQNKRPRLPPYVRTGINYQHGQQFSGTRRAPFAAYTTTIPRYSWSDHSQHHAPVFRH